MSCTLLTVLRSGGEFVPAHAQWLAAQVPGLQVLTDTPVPGMVCRPLVNGWPRWWAKMEAFDTERLRGDVLLMDLDTVVLQLPPLPASTTVLADFLSPGHMGSGFMFLTEADRARCWEAFMRDPAGHMRRCTQWPAHGDQGFLQPYLGDAAKWGPEVRSYKVHCRKTGQPPAGTQVVCFHGQPRPWAVRHDWVPRLR